MPALIRAVSMVINVVYPGDKHGVCGLLSAAGVRLEDQIAHVKGHKPAVDVSVDHSRVRLSSLSSV